MAQVTRRSARAIVINHEGRLLLIRRTKPAQAPYWTTPGGSVEPTDPSVTDAMVREPQEELGAEVDAVQQVLLVSVLADDGVHVQFIEANLSRPTGTVVPYRSGQARGVLLGPGRMPSPRPNRPVPGPGSVVRPLVRKFFET